MSGDVNDLDSHLLPIDSVDHPVLNAKPGRPMPLPFTAKRFIAKPLDQPQSRRPGNTNDVFPFLIPLENIDWEFLNPTTDAPMFIDVPHGLNILYHL